MVKIKAKKKESVVVTTTVKSLPISPRKLRLVVEAVKGKSPQKALEILPFLPQKGARYLQKAIKTAIADAQHNFKLAAAGLRFHQILVNEGMRLKRLDKSRSARFHQGQIQKRRSHLVVSLEGVKADGEKG